MAITDINISETLEAGAPSIKYTGNRDPNMQLASAPDPMDERNSMANMLFNKNLDELTETELIQLDEAIANSLADGGRAHFGLGSIIKKITKPVKKLVKSPIGKAAVLGGLGMWGMGAGPFSGGKLGGGFLSGIKPWLFGSPAMGGTHPILDPGKYATKGILSNIIPSSTMGQVALAGGLGLTAASAFEGMAEDDVKALRSNPEALRAHLEQYYRNVNSEALKNNELTDEDVTTWVESQMYSKGGRVGYAAGTKDMTISNNPNDPRNMTTLEIISMVKGDRSTPEMFEELRLRGIDGVKLLELTDFGKAKKGDVAYSFDESILDEYDPDKKGVYESFLYKLRESNPDVYGKYKRPEDFLFRDDYVTKAKGGRMGYSGGGDDENKLTEKQLKELTKNFKRDMYYKYMPDATIRRSGFTPWTKIKFKSKGGRIGFAYGPDQTAQAAGIMEGLPLRKNSAGVKELDLRDSGGFIPPVGVKEKADDIPAMLSNNEFVFTADAVRAAGGGSVEKGAQVMYDTMKNLESKVV